MSPYNPNPTHHTQDIPLHIMKVTHHSSQVPDCDINIIILIYMVYTHSVIRYIGHYSSSDIASIIITGIYTSMGRCSCRKHGISRIEPTFIKTFPMNLAYKYCEEHSMPLQYLAHPLSGHSAFFSSTSISL